MKRIAVFAVALTMLLTACGKSEGTPDSGAEVTTKAADEAVKDETTAPAETTEATTTTEPAPEASPAEDFETEENDSGLTITNYKGKDTEVIIPAEIGGKPVTVIGYNSDRGAFANNGNITKVVIPEGVTEIDATSFLNCKSLAEIEFPESLAEITMVWRSWSSGEAEIPFDGTPWLEAKRAENPLVIVNNILIDGQTCSRDVEIPDGVTKICGGVFSGCTTITGVTIPNGVEKIDAAAFYGCERLTDIVLPDSVSFIGDLAFDKCTALENVTFPNNTVEMGTNIFGGCKDAAQLLKLNYQTVEGVVEFTGFCPWLKNKALENPLVIVNGNLINGSMCRGDVVIPDSVKSIAVGAFCDKNSSYGSAVESVKLPDGITKIPDYLFSQCDFLKSVTIPESVTEIGDWAFNGTGITSVTIPKGVTAMGDGAFSCCRQLQSITIPDGVPEIGSSAFQFCEKLQSITLPSGLKKIGLQAFYECKQMKELTLPDSLESIDEDAFRDCKIDVTYKGEVYFPELYDELYAAINGD